MKQAGVYIISNKTNGKVYIGSSANLAKRRNAHFAMLRKGTHANKHLQAAWVKYGIESFEFQVLELCAEEDVLLREQAHIDQLKPQYNMALVAGAPMKGRHASEETRRKLSLRFKGRVFSEEHKAAISVSKMGNSGRRGQRSSAEHLRKLAIAAEGRIYIPLSAEARVKISLSMLGKPKTPEHIANMSKGWVARRQLKEQERRAA